MNYTLKKRQNGAIFKKNTQNRITSKLIRLAQTTLQIKYEYEK